MRWMEGREEGMDDQKRKGRMDGWKDGQKRK